MASCDVITALALFTMFLTSPSTCDEVWKKDIKVRYFSAVVLSCRQDNDTHTPAHPAGTPSLVFWISPDAAVLTEATPAADFPPHVHPVVQGGLLTALNITQVSDDAFGYYTCVRVMPGNQVLLVRWGLNVDGADFSELEEEYRKNAIVGAVAAAVMIVVVGGACFLWHFRYSKRHARRESRGKDVAADDAEEDLKKTSPDAVFHNPGYDNQTEPEVAGEASGGQTADCPVTEHRSDDNGGSVSLKM